MPLPDFEELATPPVEVEPPVVAATSLFRTQGGSPRPVEVPDGTPAVNPGTPGVEVPGNGGPVPGSVVPPGGGLPADPAVPAGGPELPHTGGGASLAALLLLGVGAFAIRWLRAERDADAAVGVR